MTASIEILDEKAHKKLIVSITGKDELKSSDRLRAYRLRADLSQSALAKHWASTIKVIKNTIT